MDVKKKEFDVLKVPKVDGKKIKSMKGEFDSIGSVVWYSVGASLIDQQRLYEMLKQNSIPSEHHPNEISDKNAWKRATKSLEQKSTEHIKMKFKTVEAQVEYMVRTLNPNSRHLVKEVKDKEGNRLQYKEIVEFEYDDKRNKVYTNAIDEEDDIVLLTWKEKMNEAWEKYKGKFTDRDIRRMLREMFNSLDSTQIRPTGGVYFVPITHLDILKGLKDVMDEINKKYSLTDYTTEVVHIPVADEEEHRNMVERKVNEDIVQRAGKKIEQFKEMMDEGKITAKQFSNMIEEIKALKSKKQEYEAILERQLGSSQEQIKLMEKQLGKCSSMLSDYVDE